MSQLIGHTNDSILSRYQQAQTIVQGILSNKLILNDAVFPHWIDNSDCCWYLRETREGREYRLVDPSTASNQSAFDHQALADTLAKVTGHPVNPHKLPLSAVKFYLSPTEIRFTAFDQYWVFNPQAVTCEAVEVEQNSISVLASPDGQHAAFVRDHNLWVRELTSGEERALTEDGTEDYDYARAIGVWGDETSADLQARWSPDSRYLLTYQLDRRQVKPLPILQHIPQGDILRPQIINKPIAYACDNHVQTYRLICIEVATGHARAANYQPLSICRAGQGFFSHKGLGWWGKDSRQAFFVDISRGAKTVRVVNFDTQTGNTRILFEESSSTFVKLSPSQGVPFIFKPLPETDELIWFSERSDWGHLYLYDLSTGHLKHPITGGEPSADDNKEWMVRDILHIDTERRELLIQTAARNTDISPYYRDICRVNIDTGELTPLATSNNDHVVFDPKGIHVMSLYLLGLDGADIDGISPSGNYMVTTRSRVDTSPVSLLIDRDGNEVMTLETTDLTGLPADWQWPEPFKLKAADGKTDLYGVIYRPPGFSPEKHYPVLDFSSPHPGFSFVPHASFSSGECFGDPYLMGAAFAALGFIVVTMEVPGMPYRHKSFQDACYGRIASVNSFADRIGGLKQLSKRYPYMDLDRVGMVGYDGITGPVYGLLEHPEFYKVGISMAFQDSRLESASIVEMYEGVSSQPTGAPYAEDLVASLEGKLLLVHGMMDAVTPATGTFRLMEALQHANKDFDTLLVPNGGHDITLVTYVMRRSWDYLVTHLQGIEPPKNFELKTAWDFLFGGEV